MCVDFVIPAAVVALVAVIGKDGPGGSNGSIITATSNRLAVMVLSLAPVGLRSELHQL